MTKLELYPPTTNSTTLTHSVLAPHPPITYNQADSTYRTSCPHLDKMRRLAHEWLLGLTLLVLLLGSLIGVPVGFVVFFYGVTNGFSINEILAIPLFLAPGFLCWWGIRIFFDLGKGYLPKVRRSLFWFYVALNPYCWFWLFLPFHRAGVTSFLFNEPEMKLGCGILLSMVLAVFLMPPEKANNKAFRSTSARRKLPKRFGTPEAL